MKEREDFQVRFQKKQVSLKESFVGHRGKLTPELTRVARMMNGLDLTLAEKRQLFFYHIWHETESFSLIKQFSDIKEDPLCAIVDPVIRSDRLTQAYDDFYSRFEDLTRKKSKAKEKEEEIMPLRGKYTALEISELTGYSVSYIKSVFKRMLKKGDTVRLDKKEVAKRDPQYVFHRRIREGVFRLRNDQSNRYSEVEIAISLTKELGQTVTKQQVKRQIRMLLSEDKIKRRVNQIK